jgi:tetratricopeptide (TPR) repeat protein
LTCPFFARSDGVRVKLESLAGEFPQSAWLAYFAGVVWAGIAPEDWTKAVSWYQKAVRLLPGERKMVELLTEALRKSQSIDEVRVKLESLGGEFPQSAWLAYFAGVVWAGIAPEDWTKAVSWCEKAVRLLPDERKMVELLTEALQKSQSIDGVRAKLESLAGEFPQSAWLAYSAGVVWAGIAPEDWTKAVSWCEKAVRLLPDEHEMAEFLTKAQRRAEKLRHEVPQECG